MASVDSFRNLTDQESNLKLFNWWEGLSYLAKIEVLLEVYYPELNISGIEKKGADPLWNKINLEEKKSLYDQAWKRILK